MSQRSIQQLVDELHELLEGSHEIEPAAREALQEAAATIRGALDAGEQDHSALEGLRERIERFEGAHPRLTEVVRRLVDQLSDMGI